MNSEMKRTKKDNQDLILKHLDKLIYVLYKQDFTLKEIGKAIGKSHEFVRGRLQKMRG
jgi:hypothetical protein